MSALEPGLYRATVRGVADTIVIVGEDGWGRSGDRIRADGYCGYEHLPRNITDARPLIVLMVPGGGSPRDNHWPRLADYLRQGGWDFTADQIEAQTKPARIPEPGLWGVVRASLHEDTTVYSWVHIRGSRWYTEHHGVAAWDVLVYPTLERDGIES